MQATYNKVLLDLWCWERCLLTQDTGWHIVKWHPQLLPSATQREAWYTRAPHYCSNEMKHWLFNNRRQETSCKHHTKLVRWADSFVWRFVSRKKMSFKKVDLILFSNLLSHHSNKETTWVSSAPDKPSARLLAATRRHVYKKALASSTVQHSPLYWSGREKSEGRTVSSRLTFQAQFV